MVRVLSLQRKERHIVSAADTEKVWENNVKLSHKRLLHSFIHLTYIKESYNVIETKLGSVERTVHITINNTMYLRLACLRLSFCNGKLVIRM